MIQVSLYDTNWIWFGPSKHIHMHNSTVTANGPVNGFTLCLYIIVQALLT